MWSKQINAGSCCQLCKRLLMSDGVEVKLVELDEGVDLGDKPVREAVFSAKITANKP
ncbi:MAG: hypothetical protein WAM09_12805 [Anaerolineales bacterium]